jgi:phosphate transport system substrate-binding protein
MTMARRSWIGLILGLCVVALTGCKGGSKDEAPRPGDSAGAAVAQKAEEPQSIKLNGAGATFPYPLYSKWVSEYNKLHPDIMINYQSIGSGGGIQQIIKRTVDFGATDAPMSDDEASKAPGKLVHLPTTLGAVVIPYNLPEVADLKLDADALAGIFLGDIKKWNDKKIAASNAGVKLPDLDIKVAYRSDGSGTTAVFTDYLGKISPAFKEKVGVGKSVKWPVGLGAKGNEGVTGQVKTTPGSIGYVELAYAMQNKMPMATLKNASGEFVKPEVSAVTAAADGIEIPDVLHVSISNSPSKNAYPIASFTYILVYEDTPDATKGKGMAEFLWWAIHDGQKLAEPLFYAPLPAPVVTKVEAKLKTLKSGAKTLLSET